MVTTPPACSWPSRPFMAFNYSPDVSKLRLEMDNSFQRTDRHFIKQSTSAKRSVSRRERNLRRGGRANTLPARRFSRAPAERFVRQCRKPAGANKFSGNEPKQWESRFARKALRSVPTSMSPMVDVMLVLLNISSCHHPHAPNKAADRHGQVKTHLPCGRRQG